MKSCDHPLCNGQPAIGRPSRRGGRVDHQRHVGPPWHAHTERGGELERVVTRRLRPTGVVVEGSFVQTELPSEVDDELGRRGPQEPGDQSRMTEQREHDGRAKPVGGCAMCHDQRQVGVVECVEARQRVAIDRHAEQ